MGEAAAVIDNPTNLDIPDPDRFYSILAALGEGGKNMFIQEIMVALAQAQSTGNLRSVQDSIDEWVASMRFGTLPKIDEAFAAAAVNVHTEPRYKADEVAEFLGVA